MQSPMQTPKYLIGGDWRTKASQPSLPVVNPATEEVLYDLPCCGPAEVEEAIAIAQDAFKAWAAVPGWQRARVLRAIGDQIRLRATDIGRAITLEMGRPLAVSQGEAISGAEQFTWFAAEAERLYGRTMSARMGGRLMIDPEPVGVVAIMTPWNFPASLLMRKLAPALAAGCAVLVRPSEQTPLVATIIGECCLAGGLPPGVVQILQGEPLAITPTIMASEVVRKISFTGSSRVGKILMAASAQTVKRYSMELGGHAPVILCDDTDVEKAANLLSRYKYMNAGQVCGSPNRFYVHDSIAEDFSRLMVGRAKAIRIGDPMDPDTQMGPLTSPAQMHKLDELIGEAVSRGARVLTGGKRSARHNKGFYYEPTLLTDVPDNARIMIEEPFGPVSVMARFTALDDAIAKANASDYGLCAFAFTSNQSTAAYLSRKLETGMVGINDLMLAHHEAPFSGVKHSGVGYENGQLGIKEYLHYKTTYYADRIPD